MKVKIPKTDVGVIIGRFQVHELHDGHKEIIDSALVRHRKVVIFIGSAPDIFGTRQNPLDFLTRQQMLIYEYPNIYVSHVIDMPSDEDWSNQLDNKIREIVGGNLSVTLYGSRDSFISHYKGKHTVVELEDSYKISGTEMRDFVSNEVRSSSEFRRGVIYSSFQRYAVAYQAVDCAVIDVNNNSIVLCKKHTDPKDKWRFPGGFVSPTDKSLESAAARELSEEVKGIGVHPPGRYVGSFLTTDWRYRKEEDKIMSSVFVFDFSFGKPYADDDICDAGLFKLEDLDNLIIDQHKPIVKLVLNSIIRQ